MSRLKSVLRRASRDLDNLGRQWALVGALAVSARTEPRFTRDIDLVVAVASDHDAEGLVRELQSLRYRAQAIVEQKATRRLATARLVPAGEDEAGVVVDVLFASSGIEPEIAAEADTMEVLSDLRIPVATIGHLISLKILARDDKTRPQDQMDLIALVTAAAREDTAKARTAVMLITKRGFNRGKDLAAELEDFLRAHEAPRG